MRAGEQHIDTAAWMRAIFNRSEQVDTRRERTKQALLRAGIELIAEERTDLSILAITQKAGVSNGSFYNAFKDRTQFFDEVAEYAVNHLAIIFEMATDQDLDSIDAAATNIRILAYAHRLVPTLSKTIVRRSPTSIPCQMSWSDYYASVSAQAWKMDRSTSQAPKQRQL